MAWATSEIWKRLDFVFLQGQGRAIGAQPFACTPTNRGVFMRYPAP